MTSLLPILISAIAIATVLNVILKRFNIPTVVGYIFTGVIIGSIFDIDVHKNESLGHIAEFGVVFLMFTIGLEFSVSHLNSMKREVFTFGFMQVFLTGVFFSFAAATLFDIDYKAAMIAGAGLALSSTAIVLKILNESGRIKEPFGKNSLGILIFQDISVIPIILMITIFTSHDKSLSELLLETALNAVIALFILVLIGKYILSHAFKAVSNTSSKEIYMGSILLTVVGASYIAHAFGFPYSLGAFIAGMMIADTIYKYQVEADLIPFRDLLLGVFFVSVGTQIDIGVVINNVISVLGLTISIMLVKSTVIFSVLSFAGDKKVAFKTAITLSQIGEFSLVIFSLLLSHSMLDPASVQIVLVSIIVSMISTPFLINNLDRICGIIFKSKIEDEALDQSTIIGGHVILCGYNSFCRIVSDQLDQSGIMHVIITNNTVNFVDAKENGKIVIFGDPSDRALLENVRIHDAMSTIIAFDDFEKSAKTSATIALIDPELKVIAKVPTEKERRQLEQFNHELILDGNTHAASVLVDRINKSRLLAKETSKLKYLHDYSTDNPKQAIKKAEREQARLFDIISQYFNALRDGRGIMNILAFHDSFIILSEIVEDVISNIMNRSRLDTGEYERINILMSIQHQLTSVNRILQELGKELMLLDADEKTKPLAIIAIEGLDFILLALKNVANEYDKEDLRALEIMTSEKGKGMAKIRESYLSAERDLNPQTRALLLSSMNHMDSLKSLFGTLAGNYKQLAGENSV
jgi:CPA2 family monovalent cation:H+ antiporter-2